MKWKHLLKRFGFSTDPLCMDEGQAGARTSREVILGVWLDEILEAPSKRTKSELEGLMSAAGLYPKVKYNAIDLGVSLLTIRARSIIKSTVTIGEAASGSGATIHSGVRFYYRLQWILLAIVAVVAAIVTSFSRVSGGSPLEPVLALVIGYAYATLIANVRLRIADVRMAQL